MKKESNPSEERRKTPRVPLDSPCFVTLHVRAGSTFTAMFTEISKAGLQLALPPGCGSPDVPSDSLVSISDFPPPLHAFDGLTGRVAWVGMGRCGITLEKEVNFGLNIAQIAAHL